MATETGTISGTVNDIKGNALPRVKITVKKGNSAAEIKVTDAQGQFQFPSLRPGTYNLEAQLFKFKTYVEKGIEVNPGGVHEMEITLRKTS